MGGVEVASCTEFCFLSLRAPHTRPSAEKGDAQSARSLLQTLPRTWRSPCGHSACLGLLTSRTPTRGRSSAAEGFLLCTPRGQGESARALRQIPETLQTDPLSPFPSL